MVIKKKYDALRDFFYNNIDVETVAKTYGYTISSFYSLVRDFKLFIKNNPQEDYFFKTKTAGRKPIDNSQLDELIISLRKQNYSTEDILIGSLYAKTS